MDLYLMLKFELVEKNAVLEFRKSLFMISKLSNIRRIFILLSVVWFAGYASATVVCANTCPDCAVMSATSNSCSATCAAISVPTQEVVAFKFTKPIKEIADFALIYTSVQTADIWKPPRQAVPSSSQFVI